MGGRANRLDRLQNHRADESLAGQRQERNPYCHRAIVPGRGVQLDQDPERARRVPVVQHHTKPIGEQQLLHCELLSVYIRHP